MRIQDEITIGPLGVLLEHRTHIFEHPSGVVPAHLVRYEKPGERDWQADVPSGIPTQPYDWQDIHFDYNGVG